MVSKDRPEIEVRTSEGVETIHPAPGDHRVKLSQWMRGRGRPLNTRCGGRGLCDACQVDLVAGTLRSWPEHGRAEPGDRVTVEAGGAPLRLRSCQHALVEGEPATLRVPDKSLLAFEPQVIADFRLEVPIGKAPLWPGPDEPSANADRPAAGPPLGAAVDIGTTTVALMLIDLDTGAVIARSSAFNKQTHLGDDVLTRINLCMNEPSLVDRFQHAIVNETIAPLLAEAVHHAGASPEQVVAVVAAGNATMLHLLVAADPASMGIAPFTPRFLEHRAERLSSVHLRWVASPRTSPHAPDATGPENLGGCAVTPESDTHRNDAGLEDDVAPAAPTVRRDAALHLLPGASAYVGADLVAGVVASGMRYHQGVVLLVDVGTNGEIVLGRGGELLGCATAAGPAFEGSGLCDGVRAARGAISHVTIESLDPLDVELEVIGEHDEDLPAGPDARRSRIKPIGICGSAYIDFLSEGVRSGLLTPVGRFATDLAPGVAERLSDTGCHSRCFKLAEGSGREPICVTEADVAALLQAKAAIAAGIVTLLDRFSLKPDDVEALYLAGGFGLHVRVASAIGSGLLPGFRASQVQLVGNTSLAGAFMATMDKAVLEEMSAAAAAMQIVELNLDPNFEMNYVEQLSLPALV